jgi:hypothetical protein
MHNAGYGPAGVGQAGMVARSCRSLAAAARAISLAVSFTGADCGIAVSQQLSSQGILDFVVQSICLDENHNVTHAFPIDADCHLKALQTSRDLATYRKHDWPDTLNVPEIALGYQASDSVIERLKPGPIVVQTFDFGNAGRMFGRFDQGSGDGGQVLVLVGRWASFAMTEDGGAGVQWFLGEECGTHRRTPDPRFLSWLAFRNDVTGDRWTSVIAKLNISSNPDVCPQQYNAAFTRFRRDTLSFAFRLIDALPTVETVSRSLEVIVSEHYGGHDIDSADHLERFFFAKGLGLVRWERWANDNFPQAQSTKLAAELLARTARCPSLASYGPPSARWLLADCRQWTTLVKQRAPWSVSIYKWPALNDLDSIH